MNFFENYAIVAMESDNVTFYACKMIKVTSDFNLKKTNFVTRWRQHTVCNLGDFYEVGRPTARTTEHFSIWYKVTYFFKLKTKRYRRKSFSNCLPIAWLAVVLTIRLHQIILLAMKIWRILYRNSRKNMNASLKSIQNWILKFHVKSEWSFEGCF